MNTNKNINGLSEKPDHKDNQQVKICYDCPNVVIFLMLPITCCTNTMQPRKYLYLFWQRKHIL